MAGVAEEASLEVGDEAAALVGVAAAADAGAAAWGAKGEETVSAGLVAAEVPAA